MPVLTVHDVTFHASHPVLADFAADLCRTLVRQVGRQVAVQVGAHRRDAPLPGDAFRLGIQTEQMRDEGGAPLWKAFAPRRLAEIAARFDAVLDLSAANAPVYDTLPPDLRSRVHFGPHVFPDAPPPHCPGGDGLLFMGAMTDRRRVALDTLRARHEVTLAPDGTFGATLDALIAATAGVLNIHAQPGTYTEVPRLLKAVLKGKVLVSEPLAAPLRPGEHYADFDAWPLNPEAAARICDAAARHMAARFALHPFLVGCITGRPHREEALS